MNINLRGFEGVYERIHKIMNTKTIRNASSVGLSTIWMQKKILSMTSVQENEHDSLVFKLMRLDVN